MAEFSLIPSKLIGFTWNLTILNNIQMTIKRYKRYHSDDLLNFFAIGLYEAQNTDDATVFGIWFDYKPRGVYATNDLTIDGRWQ